MTAAAPVVNDGSILSSSRHISKKPKTNARSSVGKRGIRRRGLVDKDDNAEEDNEEEEDNGDFSN